MLTWHWMDQYCLQNLQHLPGHQELPASASLILVFVLCLQHYRRLVRALCVLDSVHLQLTRTHEDCTIMKIQCEPILKKISDK